MKKWNVLVFPAGTEIGLEINEALKNCKEVNLFGAGIKQMNPGKIRFKKYENAPSIYDKGCIKRLKVIVKKHKIDRIFPAHDEAIFQLAGKDRELGAKIIGSNKKACHLCRSKRATYKLLNKALPVPKVIEKINPQLRFPLFAKPDRGQGSRGAFEVVNPAKAQRILSKKEMLLMEMIPGKEFTVDCFSDGRRGVLFCQGRQRLQVLNGISVQTRYVKNPYFKKYAAKIQKNLKLKGAWFYQVKENAKKELVLLEVSPRIAGSSGISRVCGVNLPLLSLYESSGESVDIKFADKGVIFSRSLDQKAVLPGKFQEAYFDFDDCLFLRGKINPECIRVIFDLKNYGAKIILISKHSGKLKENLENLGIAKIFNKVHHLSKKQQKINFISNKPSLFVDDSFKELSQAARLKNVTPLHVSALGGLSLK